MKKKDSVQDFYCIDGCVSLSPRAIAAIVAPRGHDSCGGLRGAELRTLLAFLGHMNPVGAMTITQASLAAFMGVSRSCVHQSLNRLVEAGFLLKDGPAYWLNPVALEHSLEPPQPEPVADVHYNDDDHNYAEFVGPEGW